MALRYKKYEKKYLKSCMELIRTTWLFEENFEQPKRPMYVYEYYVQNCVNWSEHLELLVDENEMVQGILLGSIEDNSYFKEFVFYLMQWKIDLAMRLHILMDRYIKFCRKNDLDSVFLWTTTECSFRFYEQYGFKERQRFAFGSLFNDEASEEGIVFYKEI